MASSRAVASLPNIEFFALTGNPISPEAGKEIRDLVSFVTLAYDDAVDQCSSICLGGSLTHPDAPYDSSTCAEREALCAENFCGICADVQLNALTETDCCGTRTACPIDQACPPGMTLDFEAKLYFPLGLIPCGDVAYGVAAGTILLPCEEYTISLAATPCCV